MTGKNIKLAVLMAVILILGGCYNYSEPDEKAWVLALGLDRGRENILTVTAVIAIPKNIAGGGGGQPAGGGSGGEGGFFTVSMEAPTLLSSLELLNAVVDRRVDLSHTTWFVFSRELAEQGISRYFAPISRFYQFRRTSHVVICEGRAEDFLKQGKPLLEDNVGKYYQLMQMGWRYTEFIPRDTFNEFYIAAQSKGVASLAMLAAINKEEPVYPDNSPKPKGQYQAGKIPRRGGAKIDVMGAAVFREGVMVGTLNADELGVRKMINGTLRRTVMDVPDPRNPGSFIIVEINLRKDPDIQVSIADGYPVISVMINLEGEIISIQSGGEYMIPGSIESLERAVERKIMQDVKATIDKSIEMETDFLGFGLAAKKLFSTWPQWEAYNWSEKYPNAEISVDVDYRIRRTGLTHEMVPIK